MLIGCTDVSLQAFEVIDEAARSDAALRVAGVRPLRIRIRLTPASSGTRTSSRVRPLISNSNPVSADRALRKYTRP